MPLEKIIVLDDDLIIRKTLEDYLRKKRYSVKSAQTINEAQKLLLKDSYTSFSLILNSRTVTELKSSRS